MNSHRQFHQHCNEGEEIGATRRCIRVRRSGLSVSQVCYSFIEGKARLQALLRTEWNMANKQHKTGRLLVI